MSELGALQERLHYRFRDLGRLVHALTHRSYGHEHNAADNERLEFLGDAVLQMCATLLLIEAFPKAPEGQLSVLRSKLVKTQTLAQIGRDLELGAALRLGRGEEDTGGRKRARNLANAVEAILGAVYLDGGMKHSQAVVAHWMNPRIKALETAPTQRQSWKDPKSRLQELTQRDGGKTPVYEVLRTDGPSHDPVFTVRVCVGEQELGCGSGKSRKTAEAAAASEALEQLEVTP